MDPYDSLAEHYDALSPREHVISQRPFFEKLVGERSVRTCLDCACGTGWHLVMLADMGVRCCGSDLSPKMLEQATHNLAGKDVPLKQADFRKLESAWSESFDMVICMTTAFPHMVTGEDAVAALRSMRNRLNDGGILVIDNGNSERLLHDRPKLIPASITKDHAFYFFLEYSDESVIVFNILHITKTAESFEHDFTVMPYNSLRKAVLDGYLDRAGFTKAHYYGSYELEKYVPASSPRQLVIAEK